MFLPLVAFSSGETGDEGRFEILRGRDTVVVHPGDSVLFLRHDFVVSGTEHVTTGDSVVGEYRLESISGTIFLGRSPAEKRNFVVSYGYLGNRFRKAVGPVIESLPVLGDSSPPDLKVPEKDHKTFPDEDLPLVADGTLFRGVSVSPNSGVTTTGGLQLALQGKLSSDMTVSGSISDQNLPIQPQGNTSTVEELDKVYLEVKHPSTAIVAGDIDMALRNGHFLDVTRRLEGLKVETEGLGTELDLYIAGTKGKFHRMEIAGEEGNQGPYTLFSDTGARDIVVLASSERIWVDGEMMERGENGDYTIDYSRGEITFTADQVIGSESRIYVEYEYSDLTYPRRVTSTSLSRPFGGGRVEATASWIRETDNYNEPLAFSLSREERRKLEAHGDGAVEFESAVVDKEGSYEKEPHGDNPEDSIYVYSPEPEANDQAVRYHVVFHNVGSAGEYARHVTPEGEVYFEYVEESDRIEYSDLYVPRKTIISPESHQMLAVSTALHLGDSTRAVFNLSGSSRDRNLLSHLDDRDNEGYAGAIELHHNRELSPGLGHLSVVLSSLKRGDLFTPLQRDRRVEFHREWNLSRSGNEGRTGTGGGEELSELEVSHQLGRRAASTFSIGRYGDPHQSSTRWEGKTDLSFHWVPAFRFGVTTATRNGGSEPHRAASRWQRSRLYVGFLPGSIHPFFRFEREEMGNRSSFDETGGGFIREGDRSQVHLGVTRRRDVDSSGLKQAESWLGELRMNGRWRSGYRLRLLLKQKIKSYALSDDLSYGLARGNLGYRPRRGNVRANLNFKLERTLFQERIAVFDSVGSGKGAYRYDEDYKEYVPDVNGAFISRQIPSGKRIPATRLSTGLRFFYDFKGYDIPYLKEVTWRLFGKGDHRGSDLHWDDIVQPSLGSANVSRAALAIQSELDYAPTKSGRRVGFSSSYRVEVDGQNGLTGLENRLTKRALSLEEPILRSLVWVADISSHKSSVGARARERRRRSSGWFLTSGPRWKPVKQVELGSDLSYGRDVGESSYSRFAVRVEGIGIHARLLPTRGGRIHASADIFNVVPESTVSGPLPPESAHGMKPGTTARLSMTGTLLFVGGISANANLTYLHDPIHDGLLTASGEVRASF